MKKIINLTGIIVLAMLSACSPLNRQAYQINDIIIEKTTSNSIRETTSSNIEEKTDKLLESSIPTQLITEEYFQKKYNEMADYLDINSDFVGIVSIKDTMVDYPILKGNDNDFYLKKDIYKKDNYYGSIFMDYRNFGVGFDKNTIIYGHNMKDDNMFGILRNYMDSDYIKENSIIQVQDLYTTRQYLVFSAYFAPNDSELIQTSFTDNEYLAYIDKIMNKSIYDVQVPVSLTDNILTLVTCSYDIDDGRYFVHAVEIDESME